MDSNTSDALGIDMSLDQPSPGVGSFPKGQSSLAMKVTSILSTSYSDTEFRDALTLIDERGVTNDPESRRRIRLDLQKEVIDSNSEILSDFGRVAEQLRRIGANLERLNTVYQDIRKQITTAHSEVEPALLESSAILEQKRDIESKQKLLGAFSAHFIMSDDEVVYLTQTAEPVDDRFFDAMAKAKRISRDCELLLGFENQVMGTELMEQMSRNLSQGYHKIYKWVQREFKMLNLENPQMSSSIRRALRVLAERPPLFQKCLDFFSEARERILSDSFYVALTGNSPSGHEDRSAKPIDMAAHDPLRYVGDMLAWVHSATVSEHEALEILFVAEGEELAKGLRSGREAEIWRLVSEEKEEETASDFNALRALHELVDRDLSGASRVLRQRVEQVIQTNEDILPAYKLANLINFYRLTFQKLLGVDSALLESMGSLELESLRQFRSLVRDRITTLQTEIQRLPVDLSTPVFLRDALDQLGLIMKTYDSSLAPPEVREEEFETVLAEALEPFLSICKRMTVASDQGFTHRSYPDAIFLVNCYLAAVTALEPFEFTRHRAQTLQEDIKGLSGDLQHMLYLDFRRQSGLDELLDAVEGGEGNRISNTLTPGILRQASQALDNFLPLAHMEGLEKLKQLHDARMARCICEEAAESFCKDFEELEQKIVELDETPADGSEQGDLRGAFPRTTAEIRVLLS